MKRQRAAHRRTPAMLLAVCLLASLIANPWNAHAVSDLGGFAVTITPPYPYEYATYTLGSFRTGNKENVVGYTIVFPGGFDASGATSPGAGDIVTVAPDGVTVTVMLGTPIPQRTTYSITLGNVQNPGTTGTYSIGTVLFLLSDGTTSAVTLRTSGTFTIDPAPYLAMTITTPDAGQMVDFGAIEPGVATPAETVTVWIDSSATYSLTRTISPEAALLGLAISGDASGTVLPAGQATYTDLYTATPPWTTPPDVAVSATVTYSVVQN